MSGHTPGPWSYQPAEDDESCRFEIFGARKLSYRSWVGGAESESDASLIAAAPELLESVRELLVCMALANWEGDPIAEKGRAAIAKATQP